MWSRTAESLVDMASWAARADHKLAAPDPTPSVSTIAGCWLHSIRSRCKGHRQLTGPAFVVDGEVLRSPRARGSVKLVAAYDHDAGLVLGQVRCGRR